MLTYRINRSLRFDSEYGFPRASFLLTATTKLSMVPQLLQTATQDLVTRFLPFGGSASPSELAKNSTSSNNLLAATQDDGQGPSIRMLPEDVLLLILSWLGPEDVVACKRVRVSTPDALAASDG